MNGYGLLLASPIFPPVPRFSTGARSYAGLGQAVQCFGGDWSTFVPPSACSGLYSGGEIAGPGADTANGPGATGAGYDAWYTGITNRMWAAAPNGTLAQQFAAAGLSQNEIECWVAHTPCYLPELETYMGTPIPTNYAAAAPALAASNATIAATAASAVPSSSQIVTSTAGASPAAGSPAAPVSGCSLALFGDTSCIGGMIGTTTAIVLAAAALALYLMSSGGKR